MQSQPTDRSRVLLAITAVCLALGLLIAAFLPPSTSESAAMRQARAIYEVVGTDEWNSRLTTQSARVRMVQIPPELILKLNTEEIVQLILEYPFIANLYAYNFYSAGYAALENTCRLIPALYERKDAGNALLAVYEAYPLPMGNELKEADALSFLRYGLLETLLAQPQIEALFTEKQLQQVAKIATENHERLSKLSWYHLQSQYFQAKQQLDNPGL